MNRMKELREERGITMKEAAIQLKMPYTTYVNYEKGEREPNSETLIKIADFYNTSIDYLLCKPGTERIDEAAPGKVNEIAPDVLNQTENIYKANGVGVNLFDEPMGFDSSAVPTLVKEAMKKQTLSVEDVAKKASIKPEILQKLLSGQNYALALYQLSAMSFVLKIPFDDMVKVDADGSVSAKAFKNITEKFQEADNSGSSLSEKEKQALKLEYTEKLIQVMAESFSNIMAFGSSVLPEFSDYVENSEEDQAKNVLHQMDELLRIIEKVNDQDLEREIMARVNSIIKIVSGYSAK